MSYEMIEKFMKCSIPPSLKFIKSQNTHIAILYNKRTSTILSYAINQRISTRGIYYKNENQRISIHAEQSLFIKWSAVRKKIPKAVMRGKKIIISLRFNPNGVIGSSKICEACADLIKKKWNDSISSVVYVDERGVIQTVSLDVMCCLACKSSGDKRLRSA